MKVIVIGAGIAGLTLGLACQRAGIDVKIYEKTNELRNIGGGILVWPHGMRYLQWLGLSHSVEPYLSSIKNAISLAIPMKKSSAKISRTFVNW